MGALKIFRIVGITVIGIITAVIFALVFGYFVMLLWNWLMPVIFSLKVIDYWQAFGIVLLARLIFGSFGEHWHSDHPHDVHKHEVHRHDDDDEHIHPRFHHMSHVREYWKYYDKWWEQEGKKSFESYNDSLNSDGKNNGDTQNN